MGLPVSSIQRALEQHVLIIWNQCLRAGGCTEGDSQHTPSLALAWKEWQHITVVVPDQNLPGKSQSEVKTAECQHLPPKSEFPPAEAKLLLQIKAPGKQKLQSPQQPEPVKSELAAVGKSSVSRVKHSPGPGLPGAGSRMDLPALNHRVSAESNLQRWNQL